jgi:triacylglycerol esterase/lipase EstA (alpha/beta hydrolase family)
VDYRDVIGHSFGGLIARYYIQRNNGRIAFHIASAQRQSDLAQTTSPLRRP